MVRRYYLSIYAYTALLFRYHYMTPNSVNQQCYILKCVLTCRKLYLFVCPPSRYPIKILPVLGIPLCEIVCVSVYYRIIVKSPPLLVIYVVGGRKLVYLILWCPAVCVCVVYSLLDTEYKALSINKYWDTKINFAH